MSTPVRLWRCEKCGKWSHAQRRPKEHERFTPEPTADERVIREDHDYQIESTESRFWVACGPFAAWVAIPERRAS